MPRRLRLLRWTSHALNSFLPPISKARCCMRWRRALRRRPALTSHNPARGGKPLLPLSHWTPPRADQPAAGWAAAAQAAATVCGPCTWLACGACHMPSALERPRARHLRSNVPCFKLFHKPVACLMRQRGTLRRKPRLYANPGVHTSPRTCADPQHAENAGHRGRPVRAQCSRRPRAQTCAGACCASAAARGKVVC